MFKDRIPDIFQGQNRKYLLDHSELKLVGFLGQGAFGVVHRGLWRSTDVAVKYVTVEYAKVFFFLFNFYFYFFQQTFIFFSALTRPKKRFCLNAKR